MTAHGTTLIYNGVILRDCETQSFEQRIEYDESGTDAIFSRFRIRVTSTMVAFTDFLQREHASQVGVADGGIGGSLGQQLNTVYKLLQQPRKDFYFLINDAPQLPSGAQLGPAGEPSELSPNMLLVAAGHQDQLAGGTQEFVLNPLLRQPGGGGPFSGNIGEAEDYIDVDNGPKPLSTNVEQIFGGRSLRVTFEIEVCRRRCCDDDGFTAYPEGHSPNDLVTTNDPNSRPVISNRWSIIESRDENWVMTRSIQGTLRVSSKRARPHLMRYFVIPTIPRGFKRVSQSFATDPTDLVLKYSIEDRATDAAPPPPAIKWSGHYAEIGTGNYAARQLSEINVRLQGAPGANKQDLIGAAGHVVKSRIPGLQTTAAGAAAESNRPTIVDAAVIEILDQPIIEMRVRVLSTGLKKERRLAARIEQMGAPMGIDGYHPEVWPLPSPYDSRSLAGMFDCFLQNPCYVWAVPRPGYGIGSPVPFGTSPSEGDWQDENADGTYDGTDDAERTARLDAPPEPVLYASNQAFDDDETQISDTQFSDSPYTHIRISTRYETDNGRIHLPFAGPPDNPTDSTAIAVKLHGGLCRRVIQVEATRRDKQPTLPAPQEQAIHPAAAGSIIEYLDSIEHIFIGPEQGADGLTRHFRASARYVYLLNRPPGTNDTFKMAVSPIDLAYTTESASAPLPRQANASEIYDESAIDWIPPA